MNSNKAPCIVQPLKNIGEDPTILILSARAVEDYDSGRIGLVPLAHLQDFKPETLVCQPAESLLHDFWEHDPEVFALCGENGFIDELAAEGAFIYSRIEGQSGGDWDGLLSDLKTMVEEASDNVNGCVYDQLFDGRPPFSYLSTQPTESELKSLRDKFKDEVEEMTEYALKYDDIYFSWDDDGRDKRLCLEQLNQDIVDWLVFGYLNAKEKLEAVGIAEGRQVRLFEQLAESLAESINQLWRTLKDWGHDSLEEWMEFQLEINFPQRSAQLVWLNEPQPELDEEEED